MVKAQRILVHYAQVIDDMVTTTQKLTSTLNGDYQLLKEAINTKTVAEISQDQWTSIKAHFDQGVADYQKNLASVQAVQPSAKAVGMHHLLLSAYTDYVAGCAQMAASVDAQAHQVDVAAFNAAEKQQDDSSLQMNKQINRIMTLLV